MKWLKEKLMDNLCFVATFLLALGMASFFLPLLGVRNSDGSIAYFQSVNLFFGGECKSQGMSFAFALNYYFLGWLMLCFLAVLASLFCKNSSSNLMITIALNILSIVGLFCVQLFLHLGNPNFPQEGLVNGPGMFIGLAFDSFALILLVLLYTKNKTLQKPKKS